KTVLLYLPWVTSSIFFVFVEFTLLSCLFYSLFNPELALLRKRFQHYYGQITKLLYSYKDHSCHSSAQRWNLKSSHMLLALDTFKLKYQHHAH
ncbi:MAG: hypothetical protein LBV62_02060, partial [Rickettsiales bacterium]|nr:hypothetical protein [Rickettsiales bacterium]